MKKNIKSKFVYRTNIYIMSYEGGGNMSKIRFIVKEINQPSAETVLRINEIVCNIILSQRDERSDEEKHQEK